MILNITNGDYFHRYFMENVNATYEGRAFPFREAMIDGEKIKDVFSDAFIKIRAKTLSVDESIYRENAKELLEFCSEHTNYNEIRLWFGLDTFCQLNLLTLLALLEKIDYRGKITLYIIDDESFEILEKNIKIQLGVYTNIYEKILIKRVSIPNIGVLSQKAIDLYFDYLSSDGALAKLILENKDKDENFLITQILLHSKDYGLSDLNAKNLIKRIL